MAQLQNLLVVVSLVAVAVAQSINQPQSTSSSKRTTTTRRPTTNLLPLVPPQIMSYSRSNGFFSGGTTVGFQLQPVARRTASYNTSRLVLFYFDEGNSSPDAANSTITQQCDVGHESRDISCSFPDISGLVISNNSIAVEPVGDWGGCSYKPGNCRLCFTIFGDQDRLHVYGSTPGYLMPAAIGQYSLKYFPDPQITEASFLKVNTTITSLLTLKGIGLKGDSVDIFSNYDITLANKTVSCKLLEPSSDSSSYDSWSDSDSTNITTAPPPLNNDSQLVCTFDKVDLASRMSGTSNTRNVNVDVFIRNGNWNYTITVIYQLDEPPSTPTTLPTLPTSPSTSTIATTGLSPGIIAAIVVPICILFVFTFFGCFAWWAAASTKSPFFHPRYTKLWSRFPIFDGYVKQHKTRQVKKEFMEIIQQIASSLAEKFIKPNRLIEGREIGKGQFGIVKKGSFEEESVALKFIQTVEGNSIDDNNKQEIRDFIKEAALMNSFQHPNVLGIYGITVLQNAPVVVLPMMDLGDLHSFVLMGSNQINDLIVVDFAVQIAKGMQYLAGLKIVHRDLAARNCLLNKQRFVKVADFGLSQRTDGYDMYGIPNYTLRRCRPHPIPWMAPESLLNSNFSEKSDVWSYGVVLWELATRGARPYAAVGDIKRHVCDDKQRLEKLPMMTDDRLYKIMTERCWDEHSSKRATFTELVQLTESLLHDSAANSLQNFSDEESVGGYRNPDEYRNPENLVMQFFTASLNSMNPEVSPSSSNLISQVSEIPDSQRRSTDDGIPPSPTSGGSPASDSEPKPVASLDDSQFSESYDKIQSSSALQTPNHHVHSIVSDTMSDNYNRLEAERRPVCSLDEIPCAMEIGCNQCGFDGDIEMKTLSDGGSMQVALSPSCDSQFSDGSYDCIAAQTKTQQRVRPLSYERSIEVFDETPDYQISSPDSAISGIIDFSITDFHPENKIMQTA